MRLTLIISSLGPGGAERVLSLLANRWGETGHEVTLITLAGPEVEPHFPLHESVELTRLGVMAESHGFFSAALANLTRIRALRRAVADSDPDAVLSFQDTTNVLTLLACANLHVPVIVSDRVDPSRHPMGRIWSFLKGRTYPRAAKIVVQTEAVSRQLPREQKERATVIPNPVLPPRTSDPATPDPRPLLAAAGRLTAQKGFDVLLRAFALLQDEFPDWTLSVFGEGEDRAGLEDLAQELNISERVSLPGKVDNLPAQLKSADIFVLSSRYEGFPNVLLEAMACGLPCVATDCPSGPAEIITHGRDGLLVSPQSPDALAAALGELMRDRARRKELGANAVRVLDAYSMDRIGPLWDKALGVGGKR